MKHHRSESALHYGLVLFFLVATFCALYWPPPINTASYFVLLVLTYMSVRNLSFDVQGYHYLLVIGGAFYYLFRFPLINALELWLDEAGVLLGSQNTFTQATETAMSHYIVPPLNYWNIWLIRNLYALTPPPYIEFIYRIPTMLSHIVAAWVFTMTVEAIIKKIKALDCLDTTVRPHVLRFIGAVAFVTYFFNPLLFAYSLDIRFYGLMLLGTNLLLYIAVTDQVYNPALLPTLFIFLLNSVQHFVNLFPFFLYACVLCVRTKKRMYLIWIAGYMLMFLLIYPKLGISFSRGNPIPYIIQQFRVYVFPSSVNIVVFILIWLVAIRIHPSLQWLPKVLFFFVALMITYGYLVAYWDLGARHFLFIVPFALLLLFVFFPTPWTTPKLFLVFVAIISLYTIPWIRTTERVLAFHLPYIRSAFGKKQVFAEAKIRKGKIILFSDEADQWYREEFLLYSKIYAITLLPVQSEQEACGMLRQYPKAILFSLRQKAPCGGMGYATYYNTYGFPLLTQVQNPYGE